MRWDRSQDSQQLRASQTWSLFLGEGLVPFTYLGDLREIISHSLGDLNSWFPVGGAIQGGLGGVDLLEKACH